MRAFLILVAVTLAACASSRGGAANSGPQRALLGSADDPLQADWQNWTPQNVRSTPPTLDGTATAFDYWQVTDLAQHEAAWAAIFGLLGEVRRTAPREYESTLRMLMTVLEPDPKAPAQLDATFFAARPGSAIEFEGVGWRLWRELPSGAAPSVTVFLRRDPRGADTPDQAMVWLFGGFDEAPSLTVRLDGVNAWRTTLADGIADHADTPIDAESALLEAILRDTFWSPVVGPSYIETPIERRQTLQQTPPQQPRALGLMLGDRDIDQVFTNSVFAPRMTLFPTSSTDR